MLGFNVRRYRNGKLLVKPSTKAVQPIRNRLTTEMRALNGTNAIAVIRKINPIVRGWASYYRSVVSKEVFALVDHHLWRVTYKWALRAHPNKSKTWVVNQYFGQFNPSRTDRWIFGDRNSGAYMVRFAWTKIVRHQMVTGSASPDDPALTDYWARRRSRTALPLDKQTLRLAREQSGLCPLCGEVLLPAGDSPRSPQDWESWQSATRKAIRKIPAAAAGQYDAQDEALRIVHTYCRDRLTRRQGRNFKKPAEPLGLA